ncbi:MAG: hypothetical protein HN945_27020 [Deltaproteobacteria bacterium]|nr:hypothetical protein [Deltaproteobacteria bacterium]
MTLQENACDEALLNQNDVSLDHYCNCLIRFNQSIADFNSNLIAVSSILKKPVIRLFPNNRLIWRIKMMSLPKKNQFSGLKSVTFVAPIVVMAFLFAYVVNGSLFAENQKKLVSLTSSGQTVHGKAETADGKIIHKPAFPLILPLEGEILSSFGNRELPYTGKISFHNGIDIYNKMVMGIQMGAQWIRVLPGSRTNVVKMSIDRQPIPRKPNKKVDRCRLKNGCF